MKDPRRTCPAFTLMELLAASSVTLIILLLAFQLLSSAALLWRTSGERMDTLREGRAAHELISRELRTTAQPLEERPTFWAMPHPALPEANGEFYFLATLPNRGPGDLCAVGYRVVWNANARCYELLRLFMDSATLHRALEASGGKLTLDALFVGSDVVTEVAARYLWDFRLYVDPLVNASDETSDDELPASVTLEFKTIGPLAAKRLVDLPITQGTWLNTQDDAYQKWIAPYEQFSRIHVFLHSDR